MPLKDAHDAIYVYPEEEGSNHCKSQITFVSVLKHLQLFISEETSCENREYHRHDYGLYLQPV